ncbi:SDR family NAD(P)-dependent oxidoreductase [Novosphingobium resinovorum]|uniref:SDR family NAD(P)-dependent oxidoreductase n=1 Tax=Novosphingobium resinovorum TaxID=158500 RepID=UPI002ED51D79|nr:SDR family NAD(P)-dependent oxidoreductase [Novosphingobium resinovorum]
MARSIIVTGGFGVLGQAVAEAFAAAGDRVARIDFSPEAPNAPGETPEGMLDIGGVDLTDAAATQRALDQVLGTHGGIDVLVNVAGGFSWEMLEGGAIATWGRMQAMNLLTAATITQLALPALKASAAGRIVNIGAGAAIKAGAGMGAYAASKSGVHRLTEALAEELGGTGVTVNAVLPSIIDTPTNRADMPGADFSAWVQPAAIARVIAFLASADGGAITGALVPVTRGG